MSLSNIHKNFRRQIHHTKNLICMICKENFFTDEIITDWCGECIQKLGDETYG